MKWPGLPGRSAPSYEVDGTLPAGGVLVAVRHTARDDAWAAGSALRSTGRTVWTGLVMPTRSVPWGSSPRTEAVNRLGRGEVVVVFPEGQRAPVEAVHKGDVEVAHLALEAGVPVVPARVDRAGGRMVLGPALDFSRHHRTPRSRAVVRAVTDEVMEALCELTGLPYRDVPAAAARREAGLVRRERAAAHRARRRAERRQQALDRQEARAEEARQAADLAEAAMEARAAAQEQARRAALEDRLSRHRGEPRS